MNFGEETRRNSSGLWLMWRQVVEQRSLAPRVCFRILFNARLRIPRAVMTMIFSHVDRFEEKVDIS